MTDLEDRVAWAKLAGCTGKTDGQVLVEWALRERLNPERGFAFAGVIWPVWDAKRITGFAQDPWIEIRHKAGQCRATRTWPDSRECAGIIIKELSEAQLLELVELLEWSAGL